MGSENSAKSPLQEIKTTTCEILYVDADGDGYDNGSEEVCYEGSIPAGYSDYTNGPDCDDNDPNAWQNGDFYYDNDGDGYDDGSGTYNICYGDTPPPGYIDYSYGPDCDDYDPTVWQNGYFYFDNDGDGYDDGTGLNNICYGDFPPSGYVDNTNGPDCDDNDPNVWQNGDFFHDNDGDGYDDGSGMTNLCYGLDPPAGYVNSTLGTDCNDNDPSVWQNGDFYFDGDGDGYDDGSGTTNLCYGLDPPSGYVNTTLGTDCNDNDPDVWQSSTLYHDADGDGYDDGSGLSTLCWGYVIPDGYRETTLGTDCDDSDPFAWRSDLLYIDNDGDGYDGGKGMACWDGVNAPPGFSKETLGTDCNDSDPSVLGRPDPPIANGTTICSGNKAILSAEGVGTIKWYDAPTGGNLLISNPEYTTEVLTISKTFYAEDNTCVPSSARTAVTVTVNALPSAVAGANRSIYSGDNTTLGADPVVGNDYDWSSLPEGFSSIVANPVVFPASTTTYTVIETISGTGCTNSHSVTVTVTPTLLQLSVFLDGLYDTGSGKMNTTLKSSNLLPLVQPYSSGPWNYSGKESVASIPDNVVDWLLIELRLAPSPNAALPGTILPGWPKACFLKSDGAVVDLDGTSPLSLGHVDVSSGNNLYVVIRHRNHIAIMNSVSLTVNEDKYDYDFTDNVSKAHGGSAGYRQIVPGVCGMVGGDTDGDGDVVVLDFSNWAADFGKTVIYLPTDIDGDGEVSVLDFSKWATNFGLGSSAPLKSVTTHGPGSVGTGNYHTQVPGEK